MTSNTAYGGVYSIQHYLITFVSDIPQVDDFLRVVRFPPPTKLTATIQLKLKVALNTITISLIKWKIVHTTPTEHFHYIIQNNRIWCYLWIVFVVDSVPDVSSRSKASNWTESQRNCKLSNFQANNTTDMCERKRGPTETGMWTNIFRVEISSHSDYGNCYFSEYIANSSWRFGSYGSIWTGPSPKKYYMTEASFGDGLVHILPYDPKWHDLFAILYLLSKIMQVPGRSIYYRSIYEHNDRLR